MLGVSCLTQARDEIRSSLLRQRSKIRDATAFAKGSKIVWIGHVMNFNENRWTRAVSDWVLSILSAPQEGRRPDAQISSRSPSKSIITLFGSHANGGTIGRLWHAIGTYGRITSARLTSSKMNGSQGEKKS
ncbi:hypothetical protein RB195_022673 [Necator americanus]|uniref:Uncharacterized protein n=1 Tax=Necator americanus TaxID=51031 RepID=A0ABR1EG52_NECAM